LTIHANAPRCDTGYTDAGAVRVEVARVDGGVQSAVVEEGSALSVVGSADDSCCVAAGIGVSRGITPCSGNLPCTLRTVGLAMAAIGCAKDASCPFRWSLGISDDPGIADAHALHPGKDPAAGGDSDVGGSDPPTVAPPLAVRAPEISAVPFTSSRAVGVIVPIPTSASRMKTGESTTVAAPENSGTNPAVPPLVVTIEATSGTTPAVAAAFESGPASA